MRNQSVWELTAAEKPLAFGQLNDQVTADVCVIGAGITGLSTALHLAEQGVDVSVLEAGEVADGGSGKSVGLVNAGLWVPPDDITRILGEEDGERANRILGAAPRCVFELISRYDLTCDATQTGTLNLAHSRAGLRELERRHQQFQRRNYPVDLISGEACHELTGTRKVQAALLDHRAGTINPMAYTRGLARAARSLGARMWEHSAAGQLNKTATGWRVDTAKGSVTAEKVVLATNAYTQDGWNAVKQHYFPGHFFQVASEPLRSEAAESLLPERQGCWDTRKVLSSIRKDRDGRLVLGSLGRGETKPESFIKAWANRIQRHYFPQLGSVTWETTWTGRIAFTPDHTLRVFAPAEGILAITGYNGRGITTGTVAGKGLAHYLVEGSDEFLPLPIKPVEPITGIPLRSLGYETGFSLYHAGQCLRVLI